MMPLGHLGIPLLVPILGRRIDVDVRLLMLGALLPDIIDKPLGHMIMSEDNGRIIAHTMIFATLILIAGIIWRPGLSISLGVSFHHILDGIFLDRETALWPLFGPFESYDFRVSQWFDALLEPYVIGEELIGLMILIFFIYTNGLYRKDRIVRFIRNGRSRFSKIN